MYNAKNFHLLNKKTRPRTHYELIGKTISKKTKKREKKLKEGNQCQNAACEQKTTSEKWNNALEKKLIQKIPGRCRKIAAVDSNKHDWY